MLSERQLSETLCFYYGYDAEGDRILALPIVRECCCGRPECGKSVAAGGKTSVWRPSARLAANASAALRLRAARSACTTTGTQCCTTEAYTSKCCFKRRSFKPKSSFMRMCTSSVAQHALCCFVTSGRKSGFIRRAINVSLKNILANAHSPFSSIFYTPIEACSVSPCSSTYSAAHSSPSSPAVQCSPYPSSSVSSPPFLHVLCPTESLDWREWIDELIEEVRNEMINETIFDNATSPSTSSTSTRSRKRKHCSALSPEDSGISSASSVGSASPPPLSKRAKKYSLASLSHEQIAERKKEQNRIAAQRYRSRKTQTLEEGRTEIQFLEKRNSALRSEIEAMEKEINQLKGVLVGASS
uniref:BZIP domain-containing protein n=1 Tax=Bursaphelenchus xylophilus TaxID=6326 RepID=A0A1I7RP32_BURXY